MTASLIGLCVPNWSIPKAQRRRRHSRKKHANYHPPSSDWSNKLSFSNLLKWNLMVKSPLMVNGDIPPYLMVLYWLYLPHFQTVSFCKIQILKNYNNIFIYDQFDTIALCRPSCIYEIWLCFKWTIPVGEPGDSHFEFFLGLHHHLLSYGQEPGNPG